MANDLSRRTFLAVTGSAAALPATALAASSEVPSLDARFRGCLEDLRKILAEMHPDCSVSLPEDTVSRRGERTITLSALKSSVPFEGDGFYEVELFREAIEICHVRRHWSDMDRCHYLYAGVVWDGRICGPREIVREHALIRKVGPVDLRTPLT